MNVVNYVSFFTDMQLLFILSM